MPERVDQVNPSPVNPWLVAMAVMFGGLLVLNLRLLGLGMNKQSLSLLAGTLWKFVNWGVAIMLITGYMMFSSEALKCYANDGFKFKTIGFVWAKERRVTSKRGAAFDDEHVAVLPGHGVDLPYIATVSTNCGQPAAVT